jgi:hypothetical protein
MERWFRSLRAVVNGGRVNAAATRDISRKNARLSAFLPENMRFKNPVKYNCMAEISQKGVKPAVAPKLRAAK